MFEWDVFIHRQNIKISDRRNLHVIDGGRGGEASTFRPLIYSNLYGQAIEVNMPHANLMKNSSIAMDFCAMGSCEDESRMLHPENLVPTSRNLLCGDFPEASPS